MLKLFRNTTIAYFLFFFWRNNFLAIVKKKKNRKKNISKFPALVQLVFFFWSYILPRILVFVSQFLLNLSVKGNKKCCFLQRAS